MNVNIRKFLDGFSYLDGSHRTYYGSVSYHLLTIHKLKVEWINRDKVNGRRKEKTLVFYWRVEGIPKTILLINL